MLLDANLLLYAVDATSPQNAAAAAWLEETLQGQRRVGLPWQTIGAFVHRWLQADPVWKSRRPRSARRRCWDGWWSARPRPATSFPTRSWRRWCSSTAWS